MNSKCRVLLISGSLRRKSTNAAVLRTAEAVVPAGITASHYDGLAHLPAFNPDDDVTPFPQPATELRSAIRAADALLFSTPEYAGALPGSFKNLLDWTVGDDRPGSVHDKPVAWVNASPRGAAQAHDSLRIVLGYVKADIVEDACVRVPVSNADVSSDGLVLREDARRQIARALVVLAARVDRKRADAT